MEKLIASLILINIVLIYFLDLKSRKIKILENNWETAKKLLVNTILNLKNMWRNVKNGTKV